MTYALQLSKDGAALECLFEYSQASEKYKFSVFVIDELLFELYHSLRFSNDDSQDEDRL